MILYGSCRGIHDFSQSNIRKLGETTLGCQMFGVSIKQADVVFQELQSKDPVEIALLISDLSHQGDTMRSATNLVPGTR